VDVCCPELGQFIQRSWAGRPHLVARSSMRVSGKSRRNWSAGPRVLARTESSPTQSGTKQGGPSRDHWAKLGRLQYTRTQYSPVMIALFSMNFIAPPSRKKSSSAVRPANEIMLSGGHPRNRKIGAMSRVIRGCALLLMAFAAWTEPALARSYLNCLAKKVVIVDAPRGSTSL
jgi:hypothetical protein